MSWWDTGLKNYKTFMRSFGEGVGIPTRDFLLDVIEDGESLLDVGCGPAITYENLKKHGRQVTYRGIDYCQNFIDACRELFPDGDFRIGDARSLPEATASWDMVLLRHLLAHTGGYRAVISEAMRVARKRVMLVMWRPLMICDEDHIHPVDGQSSDYNRQKFLEFIESFGARIEYKVLDAPAGQKRNWIWILHKGA